MQTNDPPLNVGSNDLLGRWMPVSQVLPCDDVYVLAWEQWSTNPFVGCHTPRGWTVSHEHVDAEGGWDGATVVDCLTKPSLVTHWMPLPAPPAA